MLEPREVAVPVKSVAHVQVFPGQHADGSPALYATMGQVGAPFFVIDIDLASGHCTKYGAGLRFAREAVSALWSDRHRCLYAGSCYTGHLHRFDPARGCLEDLGPINPEGQAAIFPCSMDEGPDGMLYIGSYNGCDLTRFDPATGVFTRFGRMDPVDMYLYVRCGADGTIAGLVKMTHPHVIVFDPASGTHRTVGPIGDTQAGETDIGLITGADGLLYITGAAGNYRLQGMGATPVTAVPAPQPDPSLPGGITYRWLDEDIFEYRQLEIADPAGETRVLRLDWEGDGTDIMICQAGPDGLLYGSSMLPEHLFRFDPATGTSVDLGACSTSGGEAYSLASLDGMLYIGSYPGAKLSIYDPARPYRFGLDADANPREVGSPDEISYRPRAMVAGPAGKVWMAAQPTYGTWGGTLSSYDPATGRFTSHRHILPDCSGEALTWLKEDGLLLMGFSIEGGTGAQPRATRAGLALWDPHRDAEVWQGDLGLEIRSVEDLLAIGHGRAYALIIPPGEGALPALHLLDLRARRSVAAQELACPPHGHTLWTSHALVTHGRYLYGATVHGIFRAPLGTVEVEPLWEIHEDYGPSGGGAIIGNTWYFPNGHRLLAVELPEE